MAFSFSSWFKGKNPGDENAPEEAAPPAPPAPSNGVNPRPLVAPAGVHSAQPMTRPPVRPAMSNGASPVSLRPPVPLGTRPPAVSAVPASPRLSQSVPSSRKIAFAGPGIPTATVPAAQEPEPAAPALPEAVIRLAIGDFIDRLPAGLLAPGDHPRGEEVEFLSTELYSDLAKGRASVPASAIYVKCPSIFARPISETEDVEVQLPLAKVVEQLSGALQTRSDQFSEANTTEIETPFLHVANEDNARLPKANGTTVGALPASVTRSQMRRTGQIQAISPLKAPPEIYVPLTPPVATTAGAINPSKRPPSTVRASVAGGKIRVSGSTNPPRGVAPAPAQPDAPVNGAPAAQEHAPAIPPAPAASPSHMVIKKTARIQIPPISLRTAGAPGARPPTSFAPPATVPPPSFRSSPSGDPAVPGFRPAPPAGSEPIAFRSPPTPPSTKRMPSSFASGVRPSFPPPTFPAVPPASGEPTAPVPAPAAPIDDRKISLSLAAILKGLPSSAFTTDPSALEGDQRVELPFSLIEKQLSQGKVNVPKAAFVEALPENLRDMFSPEFDFQEISIPLQEVFQNLPGDALSIRADQVVEETTHNYPTPFSQKADEDAVRLGMVKPSEPEPAAEVAGARAVEEPAVEPGEAAPENLIDTEEVSRVETAPPEESSHEAETEQEIASAAAPVLPEEVEAARTEAVEGAAEIQPYDEPPSVVPDLNFDENRTESPAAAAPVEEPVPSLEAIEAYEPAIDVSVPPLPVAAAARPASGTDEVSSAAVSVIPVVVVPTVAAKPADTVLQTLFMTEEDLDAKSLVRYVSALPGLDGCTIMFGDGLLLAGNFPEGEEKSGFTAMAPAVFKRAATFNDDVHLGSLEAITLHSAQGMVSLFMRGDICLSVRHAGRGFLPGVREKLVIVARELARTYSPDAPANHGSRPAQSV